MVTGFKNSFSSQEGRFMLFSKFRHRNLVQCFVLSLSISNSTVFAQSAIQPPEISFVDENGIDIVSASGSKSVYLAGLKGDYGELEFIDYYGSNGYRSSIWSNLKRYQPEVTLTQFVTISDGGSSKKFRRNDNGTYSAMRGSDETLTEANDGKSFTYTTNQGVKLFYGVPSGGTIPSGSCQANSSNSAGECGLLLLKKTWPNGYEISYYWQTTNLCARPLSASSNTGFEIELTYEYNGTCTLSNQFAWGFPTVVSLYNKSVQLQAISTATRSIVIRNLPGYSPLEELVNLNNANGESSQIKYASPGGVLFFKRPSVSNALEWSFPYTSHSFNPSPVQLNNFGITYNYKFYRSGSVGLTTKTSPDLSEEKYGYEYTSSQIDSASNITSHTDANGRTTRYSWRKYYLISSVEQPDGIISNYQYDTRDNVVKKVITSKPTSPMSEIVTEQFFSASCANIVICNKPNSVKDARGSLTDFTYDPTHGGVLSEMGPAPFAGSARPLKLTTWVQRYAWIKNSSGVLVQAVTPVWVKSTETACQTAAGSSTVACDTGATQTVTTYEYGATGTGEALLVKGVANASGGTTLRTCYQYDSYARRVAETKPKANLGVCP